MKEKKPNHDKSVSSIARSESAKESNRKRGENTEGSIFDAILESEPNGLTTSELAHRVKKDRETIRRMCKRLMSEKKIIKIGKFGSYHITMDFLSLDGSLKARLFKKDAINKLFSNSYYKALKDEDIGEAILGSNGPRDNKKNKNKTDRDDFIKHYKEFFVVNSNNEFSKENLIFNKLMDSIELTPYLESEKDEKIQNKLIEDRKQVILNFSQKMGILFTFIMIESLEQTDKGTFRTSIQGQDFRISESWIDNSVDMLEIWKQFQEVIRILLRTKKPDSDGTVRIFNKEKGTYESLPLDEIVRKELRVTFHEIWPHSFEVLQECVSDSLKDLKSFYDNVSGEFDAYDNSLRSKFKQIKKRER